MSNQCPLCGQALPKGVHAHELNARIQKLASPVVTAEKKKLREEYNDQLTAEREKATQRAETSVLGAGECTETGGAECQEATPRC
jgi:hypothetical protein